MLPPPEQRPVWVEALLEIIAAQQEQIHQLREENQALRDEIAVLKKQPDPGWPKTAAANQIRMNPIEVISKIVGYEAKS